ncbi:transporter suffix domain-containing protein [Thalassobacillus hwangdonensis]|uniref:Transporter suffix domain-containing protein n=1 Tax=Thalassobacillus hwangdonensis TaxID=546108 RepID=A0ABW3L390_9BACI
MQNNSRTQKPFTYKIGLFLIISSVLVWVIAPVLIPFLPLTNGMKAITITTSLVIGEIIFWIGAVMVGKEAAKKIRKSFNPKNWRKNSDEKKEERG